MILSYCQRAEFGPGQYLIHQGASADSIVMIESGHAGVEEEPGEGRSPTRLASIGPGSIIGEMGFYLQEQRSASVIAEDQMVVWVLSNDALQRLQAERPLAASKLHQIMAKVLARRLAQADRLIGVLAD
jgi:SulP family sulfate permease